MACDCHPTIVLSSASNDPSYPPGPTVDIPVVVLPSPPSDIAPVPDASLMIRMAKLGYPVTHGVEQAVRLYQDFHGLEKTGEVDTATRRSLEMPRFCGLPDVMPIQLSDSLCRWRNSDPSTGETEVTWTVTALLPRFTKEQLMSVYASAWDLWAKVCGIRPVFVDDPSKAMVQMGSRAIDRQSGVLAESELPCGNVRVCRQWYDTGEAWIVSDNPSAGQVDLRRVACHEIGHALGINHGPTGNLMAAMYSTAVYRPQSWDIQESKLRYGGVVGSPPPLLPPPAGEINIKIRGSTIEIPGYRVTKL